jgi:hypothetical protein
MKSENKSTSDRERTEAILKMPKLYENKSKHAKNIADMQLDFANEYNHEQQLDLAEVMTAFVDLNSSKIWSDETLKEKKWEIKGNSSYFRVVKQGSILVYLTFHIFSIFVILVSAVIRQSILSMGYVAIIIMKLKDGAEVLEQRNINQNKKQEFLEEEIENLRYDRAKNKELDSENITG